MVSLQDLRAPAVALDWHEAVAVGAALGTLVAEAMAPACPSAADVALLPSGDLRVVGPGVVDGTAAGGVATVLADLLAASPCPSELRHLIDRYADDGPGHTGGSPSAADLVAALAFFERPGRRDLLAAVARRAGPALEYAARAAALEALTERTRQAAAAEPPPAPVPDPAGPDPEPLVVGEPVDPPAETSAWAVSDPGATARLFVPAAVGLVAFVAVTYLAATWLGAPAGQASPPSVAAEEPAAIATGDAPGAEAPSTRPATPGRPAPAPSRQAGATVVAAPETPPGTAVPAPAPVAPAAAAPAPSPRTVDVVVAEHDGRVIAPARPDARAPGRPPAAGHVYQSDDPLVTPAVLIRPRLPDQPPPDVSEEQVGTLEFVVTESGAVEQVRLISPSNRYQDRMLVAAAKTWQFRPAMREGRPVRFRTRIRVTL